MQVQHINVGCAQFLQTGLHAVYERLCVVAAVVALNSIGPVGENKSASVLRQTRQPQH